MSNARTIAKNTAVLYISQIITYLLALFYTVYTARYLGVEGFGILSFALALGGLLSIFTELGLSTLTVREVSRDKTLANKYIGNTAFLKIILSSLTLILMILIVNILGYSAQTAYTVYFITISFLVGAFSAIFYSIFQAYEKMEYQSIGQIINGIVMFVGIILAIHYHLPIVIFALVYLITNIISLIYASIICIRKFVLPKIEIDIKLWKFLFIEALPLTISSIFLLVAFRVDTILLSIINGNNAVGLYSASYRLLEALMFIPSVYVISLFPILSRLYVSSKQTLHISYEKSFKYLTILALPIAVGTTLLANQIILFIYKSGFSQSIIALQILIWAIPIIFLNYILGTSINSINKQREMVRPTFFAMLINIVLNLLLLPKYSYIAASFITVITELASFIFWYHIMNVNGYKISFHKIFVKPIIASLIMGLFIVLVNINLILVILISTVVYFGVLFILKTFSEDDIRIFREIIKN